MIIKKNCKIEKIGNNDYYRTWLKNGALHREDGPAVEVIEGSLLGAKAYALDNRQYLEQDFQIEIMRRKLLETIK